MMPQGFTRAPYLYMLAGKVPTDHAQLHVFDLESGKELANVVEVYADTGICTVERDGKAETINGKFGLFYKVPEKATEALSEVVDQADHGHIPSSKGGRGKSLGR